MAVTLPFQTGSCLGQSVDLKSFKFGPVLVNQEAADQPVLQVNQREVQYAFINTLQDVCDILRVPHEYVLKVQIEKIDNPVVPLLLRGVHDGKFSFTLAFKASFLQQKQYLPEDAIPKRGPTVEQVPVSTPATANESENSAAASTEQSETNDVLAEEKCDSSQSVDPLSSLGSGYGVPDTLQDSDTHWVRAVEVGNELIIVVRIDGSDAQDDEKYIKIYKRLKESLGQIRGPLDEANIEKLKKEASDIDAKLKKKGYQGFKLSIHYCSPKPLAVRPETLSGMVQALQNFMDQMIGWSNIDWSCQEGEPQPASLVCMPASEEGKSEASGINISGDLQKVGFKADRSSAVDDDDEGDGDSFVEIEATRITDLFKMRVTLEPLEEEFEHFPGTDSLYRSMAMMRFPEDTNNRFLRIYLLLKDCLAAAEELQVFVSSKRFARDKRVEQVNGILKSVQNCHLAIVELINGLDFITVPSEQDVEELLTCRPLRTVRSYIHEVMSRLPPGNDLDLLLIGKTGHGKSATGNSILGGSRFLESADEHSMTQQIDYDSATVDERRIKIVDMPGVCDTNHEGYDDSIEMGIHCISEAIAKIPSGFHALLLVFSYGTRISLEERKAIELLKRLLGENVIKTHTVVIITSGDRFRQENPTKSFSDWCHSRSGFLKDLFEECDYRCALFNNKAIDEKEQKQQLINLVNHIDRMEGHGTRYTNSLFELALDAEERAKAELNAPDLSEELMNELELLQQDLNRMADKSGCMGEEEKQELVSVKESLVNLKTKVESASDAGRMGPLLKTLISLTSSVQARLEELANAPPPETQGAASENFRDFRRYADFGDFGQGKEDLDSFVDETKEINKKVKEKVADVVKEDVRSKDNCFSGQCLVSLASGESIAMKDLKVGDQVLALDGRGHPLYDTVYMFGHQEPNAFVNFVVLETEKRSVFVSADHLVFCVRDGVQISSAARNVCVGDFLLVSNKAELGREEVQSQPDLEVVTGIRREEKQGLFAPFTMTGNLFVEGALMSCYVDVLRHEVSHAMLWPVRLLHKLSPTSLKALNGPEPVPNWAKAVLKLL